MKRLALIALLVCVVGVLPAQAPKPDKCDKALQLVDSLMSLVRNQQETIKTLIDNAADMNRRIIELDQRIQLLEQQKESK